MDEPNHPGEEHHYQPPYSGKITDPSSQLRDRRLLRIFIGITTVLLVVVIVFGLMIMHFLTTPSQPVILATPTTVAATSSLVEKTPTPMPTATPALTPTPLPAGTVLCEWGGTKGWGDWRLFGPWKLLPNDKNILLSDGSELSPLVAPKNCQPQTADYAVEVTLKITGEGQASRTWIVGLYARKTNNGGYTAGIAPGGFMGVYAAIHAPSSQELSAKYTSFNTSNLHSYRMEVKSNTISFFIDGQQYVSAVDNRYFSPGEVSFSVADQSEVTSFKVQIL